MSRIIVVTSGKGGVGKTTATSNIGMALAKLNKKVLLIDADVGLRNLDLLLGLENRIIYTGSDVLTGGSTLQQALITDKRQPNLVFFPLSSNQTKLSITKEQIFSFVEQLRTKFDFILIDSPAGIDEGFQTAIEGATEAIIVVTPEVTSIRDADKVIGILESRGVKELNLLINRLRPDMVKAENMLSISDIQDILGVNLIGVIPDSERVIIAANRGEPLVLNKKSSIPGLAFDNVARRLNGEIIDVSDLSMELNTNPVRRLFKKFLIKP